MRNRTFDNHPYNVERFTKPRKGPSRQFRRKVSFREMVRRAQQRIIDVTKRRGNGFIGATRESQALAILNRWIDKHDTSIGKGGQRFAVLRKAFQQLVGDGVLRSDIEGYVLNLAA